MSLQSKKELRSLEDSTDKDASGPVGQTGKKPFECWSGWWTAGGPLTYLE